MYFAEINFRFLKTEIAYRKVDSVYRPFYKNKTFLYEMDLIRDVNLSCEVGVILVLILF